MCKLLRAAFFVFILLCCVVERRTNALNVGTLAGDFLDIFSTLGYNNTFNDEIENEYDFIVVGAGSAGTAIAARLSEISSWNILLLEVGDVASIVTDGPAMAPIFQFSNYNWGYLMEKQDNVCLGMKEQRCAWPRGKALGGSSIINYMIHVRGNKYDYDKWASLGNPGWSYKEVLPYFIKLEDSHLSVQDKDYRGIGGPMTVSDVSVRTEAAKAFIKAAKQAGHQTVDYNGRNQLGFSFVQGTTRNGWRCSTEKAYLRPVRERKNFQVSTRSRVTKIVIDKATKQTVGVEFTKDGKNYRVKARKEVILSAGAFHSPQLLMLSGIGPRNHLEELNIEVIKDLPVGELMYDHNTFPGLLFKVNESITLHTNIEAYTKAIFELILKGTGLMTSLGGVEALGYIKTHVSDEQIDLPDVELIFIGGGLHTDKGRAYRKAFRITDEIYDALWKPLEDRDAFTVMPMLLHPKSRGYVKLRSKNPFDSPELYGEMFTDKDNNDLKAFLASIREVQRIVECPALQRYNAQLVTTKIPGCEEFEFDSDFYWECGLRHLATTLHHQVGTCKMGPASDDEAVVDNELRVHGIGGLRVADISVIPIPIAAHTNIPAVMIGEKAADIVKKTWL